MQCWAIAPLVAVARALARLPQSALWALSGWTSWLATPLLGRRRRIARTNIALCFPDWSPAQRRQLLRANQRAMLMGVIELMRAWYAPRSALRGLADIEGAEHLQAALAAGRGVLLMTGHFMHTELAGRLLKDMLDPPLRGLVRRHNDPCIERALESARSAVSGPTLAKKDMRGLLRSLQAGEVIVYSADQDFNYQCAFVPFFGVPAATLTGTTELARRGNAIVLPFWCRRGEDGRYLLRIEPTWPDWAAAEGAQAAAIYMRELEEVVRRAPEQYLWAHRRFKTRPPGEPSIYE